MPQARAQVGLQVPTVLLCYHVATAPGDAEAVSNAVDLPDPDPLAVLARPRAVAKTGNSGKVSMPFDHSVVAAP